MKQGTTFPSATVIHSPFDDLTTDGLPRLYPGDDCPRCAKDPKRPRRDPGRWISTRYEKSYPSDEVYGCGWCGLVVLRIPRPVPA